MLVQEEVSLKYAYIFGAVCSASEETVLDDARDEIKLKCLGFCHGTMKSATMIVFFE